MIKVRPKIKVLTACKIGSLPSRPSRGVLGRPLVWSRKLIFGSGSSYHAPQGYFWGYIRCPRGAARTGPGDTTVPWSGALEPSESVFWRPDLMRFYAITAYLSMSD